MVQLHDIDWLQFIRMVDLVGSKLTIHFGSLANIYFWGPPTNGTIVAGILVKRHGGIFISGSHLPAITSGMNLCVIDDICDSGRTLTPYGNLDIVTASLYRKVTSTYVPTIVGQVLSTNHWLVFPWEQQVAELTAAEKHRLANR